MAETVTLAPAGYHLMLERLNRPLTPGQRAPLTLTFADGKKLQVELAVESVGARATPGMKH